jgi:hypothetical protein
MRAGKCVLPHCFNGTAIELEEDQERGNVGGLNSSLVIHMRWRWGSTTALTKEPDVNSYPLVCTALLMPFRLELRDMYMGGTVDVQIAHLQCKKLTWQRPQLDLKIVGTIDGSDAETWTGYHIRKPGRFEEEVGCLDCSVVVAT